MNPIKHKLENTEGITLMQGSSKSSFYAAIKEVYSKHPAEVIHVTDVPNTKKVLYVPEHTEAVLIKAKNGEDLRGIINLYMHNNIKAIEKGQERKKPMPAVFVWLQRSNFPKYLDNSLVRRIKADIIL